MKKIAIIILAIVIVGTVAWKYSNRSPRTESVTESKPVIRIGAVLPLSGNMANTGQSIKRGIEFAIEDINKSPDNKFIYQAVFEDNQLQARLTIPATNKLIHSDHVSAIMTVYSSPVKAMAPLIINNKIIGLFGTYSDETLDGVYNFGIFPNNSVLEHSITQFVNSYQPKKIAFVTQQTPAELERMKNFKKLLQAEIREFDIYPDERDFKMLVLKMKGWNPDLVIVSVDLPGLDIIGREMQRQEVGGTKLGLDLINRTENFLSFEGFYTLNSSNGTPEFAQRFGRTATYYAPYFYDSMMIFRNAVEQATVGDEIPSSEAISAEIHKLSSYDGVVGQYEILGNGRFKTPIAMYKIENGTVIETAIETIDIMR